MILKELEPQQHSDPLRRAEDEAVRQMARDLKRAFGEAADIHVLNHLRLQRGEETAHIDHLVLHRYGAVLIESRWVAGQTTIDENGEWSRLFNGQSQELSSPILQARRRRDLLHTLLNDHAEPLLGTRPLGKPPADFGAMPVDVVVALSDNNEIKGHLHRPPEVLRAHQVPDHVREQVRHGQRRNSESSLHGKTRGYEAIGAEVLSVAAFLQARHVSIAGAGEFTRPLLQEAARPSASVRTSQERQAQARPQRSVQCRTCQSTEVSVQDGKYGYHLHCGTCQGNTPAKPVCAVCGQLARLSRQGSEFTATCSGGHRWLYWTNPDEPTGKGEP